MVLQAEKVAGINSATKLPTLGTPTLSFSRISSLIVREKNDTSIVKKMICSQLTNLVTISNKNKRLTLPICNSAYTSIDQVDSWIFYRMTIAVVNKFLKDGGLTFREFAIIME